MFHGPLAPVPLRVGHGTTAGQVISLQVFQIFVKSLIVVRGEIPIHLPRDAGQGIDGVAPNAPVITGAYFLGG